MSKTETGNVCPSCSSTRVRIIPWRDRMGVLFTIRSPRECEVCRTRFVPPSGIWVRICVIAAALLFSAMAVPTWLVPDVTIMLVNGLSFEGLGAFIEGGLAAFAVYCSLCAAYVAAKSGNYLVLDRHEADG